MASRSESVYAVWDDAALASAIGRGLAGAYLFFGEEDYLKSHYRDRIASRIMTEGFEMFNDFRISFSPAAAQKGEPMSRLSDALAALPMMQEQKLIVLSDLAPATLGKDELEALCASLAEASRAADTVLILYCRASELAVDYKLESSAVYKKLVSVAQPVRFDRQPRGKLIPWIKRHFSEEKLSISDDAAALLYELCVGSMTALSFEMQKLICYAADGTHGDAPNITREDVARMVVPCDPDEMPFAMLNAAQSFRLSEMLAVFETAREQREEPVAVLARLARIYLDMLLVKALSADAVSSAETAKLLKMKDFRIAKYREAVERVPIEVLERGISLCYETDKALKSLPTDPWVLLDALAVELYAPKSLRQPKGQAPC